MQRVLRISHRTKTLREIFSLSVHAWEHLIKTEKNKRRVLRHLLAFCLLQHRICSSSWEQGHLVAADASPVRRARTFAIDVLKTGQMRAGAPKKRHMRMTESPGGDDLLCTAGSVRCPDIANTATRGGLSEEVTNFWCGCSVAEFSAHDIDTTPGC